MLFSLLNGNLFGPPTYTAFFLSFCVLLFGVLLLALLAVWNRKIIVSIPAPVFLFVLLTGYIVLRSILEGWRYIHCYWLAIALLLVSFSLVPLKYEKARIDLLRCYFHNGIIALAALEGLLVLLQTLHIVSSLNKYFTATGSWANPNVTAMFCSLSLFSITEKAGREKGPAWRGGLLLLALALVLLAILLLRSRTAYLSAGIVLVGAYGRDLLVILRRWLPTEKSKVILFSLVVLFLLSAGVSLFTVKSGSSDSRLHIWSNSMRLASERPFAGRGIGLFEMSYNLFTARNPDPANTYVSTAYNDFLELEVEGGIPAVSLWIAFLISLAIYCRRNGSKEYIPIIIAFAVMQAVNFVIQAVPVMLLFILYVSLLPPGTGKVPASLPVRRWKQRLLPLSLVTISALTLVCHYREAVAFHRMSMIYHHVKGQKAIALYQRLRPVLNPEPLFHEHMGDAYLSLHQYQSALYQYLTALSAAASPKLLAKAGDCYAALKDFGHGETFYRLSGNIVPSQFGPCYALLRLYETKRDNVRALQTAQEIIDKPVKIQGPEVDKIKLYAAEVIQSNNLMHQ